jgi:hypothetical protein
LFHHRGLLAIACVIPLVVASLILLFGLVMQGQIYWVMIPFALSFTILGAALLQTVFSRENAKLTTYQITFAALMLTTCGWNAWICWISMGSCFMGACV